MHITSIGIDLGKSTFHLVALGERSKVLVRKKFSRSQPLAYTANLPPSIIGLEACSGAHLLGAELRKTRSHSAAHPRPVRKALPKIEQERLHRCGSDRRSAFTN